MKKFFTLVAAFFTLTAANAQTDSVKMEGPTLLEELMANYVVTLGVSADGTYVYGSLGGDLPGCIYNVKTEDPLYILSPELDESLGIQIAGITADGIAFVSENNIAYMLNLKDSTRVNFVSPEPEAGMDIWDVTSDGKFFAGNVTDLGGYYCKPLYGERQEDGTYKMVVLDAPELDAMGTVAQFSQARFISPDGNYVAGIQVDERGFAPRALVWEKQADGTFNCIAPMDEALYDLTLPKPGKLPEYDEVVTADPETDPELWAKQDSTFTAEYEKCDAAYHKFVKGQALRAFMMNMGLKNGILFAGVDTETDSEDMFAAPITHPIMYNCETKELTYDPEGIGTAFEQLPDGGYIKFDDSSMAFYKSEVVKKDGTTMEFTQWLKDLTGVDISDRFFYEAGNPMTGEEFSDVFSGLTYFSQDGKTLALYGYDSEFNNVTYVLTFDRDIYDTTPAGIDQVKVLCAAGYKNNTIAVQGGEEANVQLYGANGVKYGEYNFAGTLNLKNLVPAGSYIARVKTANGAATLKIIVK